MYLCILPAVAVTDVYGVLKHSKAIFKELLPKAGIVFPVPVGIGRQIKEYKYPQNPVLVNSVVQWLAHKVGRSNLRLSPS